MIKRWMTFCITLAMLSAVTLCMTADAVLIDNFQSAFRMEGSDLIFTPDFSLWDGGSEVIPPTFSHPDAGFIEFSGGTGLGTISFDIERAAGATGSIFGSFHSYFDLEVDETINTFFNEYGDVGDLSALGNDFNPNAFEIDEPGFVFGDIPWNFEDGDLDNFNNVPVTDPDDVAVALGWENFELLEGQSAELTLVASDSDETVADEIPGIDPADVFTLKHIDPDSDAAITFSGALQITGAPPPPSIVDVYFAPPTSMVLPGDTFTMGLFADIPDPVLNWGFDLSFFDSSILSLDSVNVDSLWDVPISFDADDLAGSISDPLGIWGSHIPLAELTFTALDYGSSLLVTGFDPLDSGEGFLLEAGGYADVTFADGSVDVVPEPSSLLLLAVGLGGLSVGVLWKKKQSQKKNS